MESINEVENILNNIGAKLKEKGKEEKEYNTNFSNFLKKGIEDYESENYEMALLNLSIGLGNRREYISEEDKIKYNNLINLLTNKLTNNIDSNNILTEENISELNRLNGKKPSTNLLKKKDNIIQTGGGIIKILPTVENNFTDYQTKNEHLSSKYKANIHNFIKNHTLDFSSIPGYKKEKEKLLESFIQPNIYGELYYSKSYTLLYGPNGNNKKLFARMCLGELKSVLTDTHITYIEFDLQKTMLYAEIEIENILNQLKNIIDDNKKNSIKSKVLIYLEINNENKQLLFEILNYISIEEYKDNFMLIVSVENLLLVENKYLENFRGKIFIDMPDFYERIFYLFNFIVSRYVDKSPDKLVDIAFEIDQETDILFFGKYNKYRSLYLEADGINLLELYPRLYTLSIKSNMEKSQKIEGLTDYKKRLKDQLLFISYVDSKYYNDICLQIDRYDDKNTESIINIDLNKYIQKFSNIFSKKIVEMSGIQNLDLVLKVKNLEKSLLEFYIFLHFISEITGPNEELYRLGIVNGKKFSKETLSSYGFNVNELEALVKDITANMAVDIIRKIEGMKKNETKTQIHGGVGIEENVLKDSSETDFDIKAYFKMSFFSKALLNINKETGNNDDCCLYYCDKMNDSKCGNTCRLLQDML